MSHKQFQNYLQKNDLTAAWDQDGKHVAPSGKLLDRNKKQVGTYTCEFVSEGFMRQPTNFQLNQL